MNIAGQYRISAGRQRVWEALNDPEVLNACVPGCTKLVKRSDSEFEADIQTAVGPVRATFATKITLLDLQPPSSYRIAVEGKGGSAGFGRGEVKVLLSDDGDGTLLAYSAEIKVSGRLAQIGARLIEGTARQLSDEFFRAISTRFEPAAVVPSTSATESRGFLKRRAWVVAVVALALASLVWWLVVHGFGWKR